MTGKLMTLLILVPAAAGGASFAIRRMIERRANPGGSSEADGDSGKGASTGALPSALSAFELYCLGLAALGLLLAVSKGIFGLIV